MEKKNDRIIHKDNQRRIMMEKVKLKKKKRREEEKEKEKKKRKTKRIVKSILNHMPI